MAVVGVIDERIERQCELGETGESEREREQAVCERDGRAKENRSELSMPSSIPDMTFNILSIV